MAYEPLYFKRSELECPCCGEYHMSSEFLQKLDNLRAYLKFPFIIASGFRCREHNEEVGGSPMSAHMAGRAVDIYVNGESALEIVENAREFGFTGVGVMQHGKNRYIHIDNLEGTTKQPRPWLYSYPR